MREKLVIVPQKKTIGKKLFSVICFVITCWMLLMAISVAPVYFMIPAIVFGLLWYFQTFRSDIEYEYTYYNGDLCLAKIKAKSRRKVLAAIQMEDVLMIAPKGDRSIYKYENDSHISCKRLISGNPDARVYTLVCKEEKGIVRYEFEPDEDMLDAVIAKFPHSTIK